MQLHDLKPAPGSKKVAKRKGQGPGSGNGKTAGRGQKGQKSRSGGGVRPGFEGGQMPLARRLPKRGFTNIFKKEISVVNLEKLNIFEDDQEITIDVLKENGLVNKEKDGVKILGNGDMEKKLVVKANAFSKTAIDKIEQAGGKAEVI